MLAVTQAFLNSPIPKTSFLQTLSVRQVITKRTQQKLLCILTESNDGKILADGILRKASSIKQVRTKVSTEEKDLNNVMGYMLKKEKLIRRNQFEGSMVRSQG